MQPHPLWPFLLARAHLQKKTDQKRFTPYRTVTEVYDWGAAVAKVIVDLGMEAGSENVHLSVFDDVHDLTGFYRNSYGTPYQYNSAGSMYINNVPVLDNNGKKTAIIEWTAS
ncbi:hypothetical protein SAMN04488137_1743 [Fictibacillus solisalsi]|uniref:Uncharacterized protein n=1 Tax=Fictibacillus solisalsi TaxID=459525 RepID=A0A1G9VRC3_9BACL|nr:hypothetical protein SAMN04488137_1743 [Fictibacillus solisalsi]